MIIPKYSEWKDTVDTLGMYIQMAGKVMLAWNPREPEWEEVAMKIIPRGISTGAIITNNGLLQIEFDFVENDVIFTNDAGRIERIKLEDGVSVADFYEKFLDILDKMDASTKIYPIPQEWSFKTPFNEDIDHKTYDPIDADRIFELLKYGYALLYKFAAPFRGRRSAIDFWWGTFDLATARYSGKLLPLNPDFPPGFRYGVDAELVEFGLNIGNGLIDEPYFFVFFYPLPEDIKNWKLPEGATFNEKGGQFIIPVETIQNSKEPEKTLMNFFQNGYEAATSLQKWENLDVLNKPLE